jgi:5'-nucleotidase
MRIPNNQKLAREVGDLDFILAGHDHVVFTEVVNGVRVLTSGTNFEDLSVIDIYPKSEKHSYSCRNFTYELDILKVPVTNDYDKDLKRFVD